MRLWTLHPQYLDAQGLVALWRETLLAREVLRGNTLGYRSHPQLIRFRAAPRPLETLNAYLAAIHVEAVRRGYRFDRTKLGRRTGTTSLRATRGQMRYEWQHLRRKLSKRSPKWLRTLSIVRSPRAHPLFRITRGPVAAWERPIAR